MLLRNIPRPADDRTPLVVWPADSYRAGRPSCRWRPKLETSYRIYIPSIARLFLRRFEEPHDKPTPGAGDCRSDLGLSIQRPVRAHWTRSGLWARIFFWRGLVKSTLYGSQKPRIIKRLDEESESPSLHDGGFGGMIFMPSDKNDAG
jgi:hypothetical protein